VRNEVFGPAWALLCLMIGAVPANAASEDAARRCSGMGDDRARLACYDSIFRKPGAGTGSGSAATSSAAATGASAAAAAVPAASAVPASAASVPAISVPSVTASTAPATATPVNPQDDFGLTEAAKRARDPEKAKETMPESITQEVAAVTRKKDGELVVTLANGQVWTQLETDRRARVSVGDTVTIKRAALGSYLLVTESKLATRVRRTR
jgi:hypothetical protein